jgi:tellurite resistance protein TehA-like permease
MHEIISQDDLATLGELERKVLWLASWTIHHANHLRENTDGVKVGGHQASSASLATIMTALYFRILRPQDRIAVKPHTLQDHSMDKMTAVWLLPIVAAEVAAVSGALLVPHLSPSEALSVLILCYALWAFSVPLAMSILVVLLLRLVLHKLPEPEMAASGWLALGPIGTGALALVLLGGDAPAVFAVAGLRCYGGMAPGGSCSRY